MNAIKTGEFEGVEELRKTLVGELFLPGDEGFGEASSAWNLVTTHAAQAVLEPKTVADVQLGLRFAAKNNLTVGIQTTGHGQMKACDGLLINMRSMNGVTIDIATGIAKIGGGATWTDVIRPASELGLAPLSGSSPDVGAVGYLLGGGYNLMIRKYGLGIDTIRAVEMVKSDGSIVHASETENPELLWAIRGGGGGLGVITRIDVQLFRHAEIFGGSVFYPVERAEEVMTAWLEWTKDLSEEISSAFQLIHLPPVPFVPEPLQGKSFAIVIACSTASTEESEALLHPIRSLGGSFMDNFRPMPYSECATIFNDPVDPVPFQGTGALLREFATEDIQPFLREAGEMASSPNLMIQIRHIAGQTARNAHATCATSHREAKYLLHMLGVPIFVAPPMIEAQAEKLLSSVEHQILSRGPMTFIGENLTSSQIERVLDESNWARLKQVKDEVDPANRFAFSGSGIRD